MSEWKITSVLANTQRGNGDMPNDRALFMSYCRQKGTRCDKIMTMIEAGLDKKLIAKRFGTDVGTIRVFEKALNWELTRQSKREFNRRNVKAISAEEKARVVEAYNNGMTIVNIEEAFRLTRGITRGVIEEAYRAGTAKKRRKGRRNGPIEYSGIDNEVRELYLGGLWPRKIAEKLGLDRRTVNNALKRLKRHGMGEEE